MRLVIARCSVDYQGRLTAHLPEAIRLLMVKADGCVAIHADGGAYKPLNWMNAPNTLVERPTAAGWSPTRRARQLTITHRRGAVATPPTSSASTPACRRTASRPTCRSCSPPPATRSRTAWRWCAASTRPTIGPIDLLCRDAGGRRRRHRGQAPRRDRRRRAARPATSSASSSTPRCGPVRGVFVAQVDQAAGQGAGRRRAASAASRSTTTTLRGVERAQTSLF